MSLSDFPLDRRKQLLLQRRPDKFDRRFRRRKIWALDRRRPEPGSNPSLLWDLRWKGPIDFNLSARTLCDHELGFTQFCIMGLMSLIRGGGGGRILLSCAELPNFFPVVGSNHRFL